MPCLEIPLGWIAQDTFIFDTGERLTFSTGTKRPKLGRHSKYLLIKLK